MIVYLLATLYNWENRVSFSSLKCLLWVSSWSTSFTSLVWGYLPFNITLKLCCAWACSIINPELGVENGLILRKCSQGLVTRDDEIMSPSMVVYSNVVHLYISCFIMGFNGLKNSNEGEFFAPDGGTYEKWTCRV